MNVYDPEIADDVPRSAVDDMLRRFFRHEMPDPWPELRLPPAVSVRKPKRLWQFGRSRLALAASVGFLALGIATAGSLLRGDNAARPGILPDGGTGMLDKGRFDKDKSAAPTTPKKEVSVESRP